MVNQKSIVLVPFPYSDQSGIKVRPALVVSNTEFNKGEDLIICALTSHIKNRPYAIIITSKDTIHKRLEDKSQIRADTITRIKRDLIIKEIDTINEATFKKVLLALYSMI